MTLVPYDVNEFKRKRRSYKKTKVMKILEEFQNSDYDCVKIENHEYKNARSCYGAFYKSVKRFGFATIEVHMMNGEVFLLRVEP